MYSEQNETVLYFHTKNDFKISFICGPKENIVLTFYPQMYE